MTVLDRLIKEQSELFEKLKALQVVLRDKNKQTQFDISKEQLKLMTEQELHMHYYNKALLERISNLKSTLIN